MAWLSFLRLSAQRTSTAPPANLPFQIHRWRLFAIELKPKNAGLLQHAQHVAMCAAPEKLERRAFFLERLAEPNAIILNAIGRRSVCSAEADPLSLVHSIAT